MKRETAPLSKLLLPVDTLEAYRRVLPFVKVLYRTMSLEPEHIDVLHVIEGSFLKGHMHTIDLSSGEVPTPGDMKRLRDAHITGSVKPLLKKAVDLLQQEIADTDKVEVLVRDGDPVRTIAQVCRSGDYSTLVMSRRNIAETEGKLTGSVVSGVLHRHVEQTLFLIGDGPVSPNVSPFQRCLIGIDGSPASKNAVMEAGVLLSKVDDEIEKVHLVHVLDQSCYYDEDGISCMEAGEKGQKALEEAGNILVAAGVDQEKITTVIHFGKPGTVLAEEIIGCDATLVFIGRRDRSRMAQVFLGSVCTDIIQDCRDRTIVLSC